LITTESSDAIEQIITSDTEDELALPSEMLINIFNTSYLESLAISNNLI